MSGLPVQCPEDARDPPIELAQKDRLEEGPLSETSRHVSARISGEHVLEPVVGTDTEGIEDPHHPPSELDFHETVSKSLEIRLYTSHFLSTWNSRLFEFAAVLFLASIFPSTLLPMSVYALVRSGAAILFAQLIGGFIDSGDRLWVVRTSIIGQRLSVVASCGLFWVLEQHGQWMDKRLRNGLFAATVLFACVEKLSSITNLVSVERDWVVIITEGNESARRLLNARIRRIDLFCKLMGPLAISSIAITSTLVAIWATLAMSLSSVLIEYICIEQVYRKVPSLRSSREVTTQTSHGRSSPPQRPTLSTKLRTTAHRILPISSLPFYIHHSAFLPSFSLALLYLTVLSFSGQMITYLISVGYNPLHVGIARTVSTIFELSATWIAPKLMRRIGVIRGGIWSLCWQMIWLAGGISWFFADFHGKGTNSAISATGLAVGVALSRVGLWGYDLCAQNIVQDEVESNLRGTFSTIEASFQNLFELLSYVSTIIFSRPDQFQWPVVISVIAVYSAGGLYASFVRKRRGHLFHRLPFTY
ncbi:hypothetical protein BDZ89DRAFT_1007573 [Hymenopellis radicata]|nr:hypothetical protein BDZ89DRAFT_1007573 [Hymenopellis radicata]